MADWKSNPLVAVAAGAVLILTIIITVLSLQPKKSSYSIPESSIPTPAGTLNTQ